MSHADIPIFGQNNWVFFSVYRVTDIKLNADLLFFMNFLGPNGNFKTVNTKGGVKKNPANHPHSVGLSMCIKKFLYVNIINFENLD